MCKYMWINYTMCHEGLMGKCMCIIVRPTYVDYAQNLAQNAFWNFPKFQSVLQVPVATVNLCY